VEVPEDWREVWFEMREEDPGWAARYGEESLKAAMAQLGDLPSECYDEPLTIDGVPLTLQGPAEDAPTPKRAER
jgi:hypothetical protein